MYRLVRDIPGLTAVEIDRTWSTDQVFDHNEYFDYQADVETWQRGPMPPRKADQ